MPYTVESMKIAMNQQIGCRPFSINNLNLKNHSKC